MVDPEHNHNLLFAGTESLIEAWNAASSEPCGEFKGHEDRVNCLKTHKGDLMSASQDGTLKRWERKTQKCLQTYDVCEYPVSAFELMGPNVYCATWDNCIRCIDLASGERKHVYKGHDHIINSLGLMPKDRMNPLDQEAAE